MSVVQVRAMVAVLLALCTLVVYWQVKDHGFVNYDDNVYITANEMVQTGITWKGIAWAFTGFHANFWHPLTWLSYMVDWELFGPNPAGHHFVSVFLHFLNAVLLFEFLFRSTEAAGRSAFVALLFALHPLHVESVAWASQRKDLLSTLFLMLSLLAYRSYSERPIMVRYAIVLILFALGLMSKPMLVTFPFLLVLLDHWPLRRPLGLGLIKEKIGILMPAVLASLLALIGQQSGEVLSTLSEVPWSTRLANALIAYATYILKTLWPAGLAPLYPLELNPPLWKPAISLSGLVIVSFLAARKWKSSPYLAVGWSWYLGTLVPVIGLVHIGSHGMADRYTYVPLIGLFIMVSWGAKDLFGVFPLSGKWLMPLACASIAGCMIVSWNQAGHWKNSIVLFSHTLEVNEMSSIAQNNLGHALSLEGRFDEAMKYFENAVRLRPDYVEALFNMGLALAKTGRNEDAKDRYAASIRVDPRYVESHVNLANLLAEQGNIGEARSHYEEALRIKPGLVQAHMGLGRISFSEGRLEDAYTHFSAALKTRPDSETIHYHLGVVMAKMGRRKEAIEHFYRVVNANPGHAEAHFRLASELLEVEELDKAISHFKKALGLRPDYAEAHFNAGVALGLQGRFTEAIPYLSEAVRIRPDSAVARMRLSQTYWLNGDRESALKELQVLKSLDAKIAGELADWMKRSDSSP